MQLGANNVDAQCSESIYRQATAKHPIARCIEASALPSRVARSYRATTAYQAPVWPDFPPQVNVDTQSTCIRLRCSRTAYEENALSVCLLCVSYREFRAAVVRRPPETPLPSRPER